MSLTKRINDICFVFKRSSVNDGKNSFENSSLDGGEGGGGGGAVSATAHHRKPIISKSIHVNGT